MSSTLFSPSDVPQFGDLSLIDGSSQPANEQDAKNTYITNLDKYFLPGFDDLETVDDFVASLDALGVPGPLILHAIMDKANELGGGAQFTVYAGSLLDSSNCEFRTELEPVAIKRCMFEVEKDKRIDLASPKSRRQVHDMYLEVMALQHTKLKTHRNIVRLLGWGIEENWLETPLLALELALADLYRIFQKKDIVMTYGVTQQLSIDVGNGLDAIHESGIIHGDIKPQNVLVFQNFSETVPFVAKLADFGLSVGEVHASMNDSVQVIGSSASWCAPEIRKGAKLSASQLIKADNFSYGLLVLSINCLKGQPPASKDPNTALEVVRSSPNMPTMLSSALQENLVLLLKENFLQRPLKIGGLLNNKSQPCIFWEQDDAEQTKRKQEETEGQFSHPWALPSLAAFLFQGLGKSYERYKSWMTGPQLFAMFLLKTFIDVSKADKSIQMEMLLSAAEKGHIPAQAVVSRVFESYGIPHEVNKAFLYNGASHGSPIASQDLEHLDSRLASEARHHFRGSAGFNQFYSPLPVVQPDGIKDASDNTRIQYLATYGKSEELQQLLEANDTTADVNADNMFGETALYKACMTGCWETVKVLCQHKADPSIPAFLNDLTCLHWLFNFPPACIEQTASALVRSGADPNAWATPTPSVMDYHFPFAWPSGTPLHFATAASNLTAVTALLKLGAQANFRNGRDPYLSDENVRQLHCHGTEEEGDFSEPDKPVFGLSSVDLAAAMHNADVLECMRVNDRDKETLLSPDEEGYTPFHRLSYFRMARTYNGLRFWYPAFRGNSNDVKESLIKTIRVLQSMGGDINQLTNTPARPALSGVSGLSPLHIAVTKSDCEAVAALLECGAEPNLVNRDGRSPLTLLGNDKDPSVAPNSLPTIIDLLIEYGANVNQRSSDDVTPLGAAVASDCMSSVHALIKAGADPGTFESGLNVIAQLMHQSTTWSRLDVSSTEFQATVEAREHDIMKVLNGVMRSSNSRWISQVDRDNGNLLHYASRAGLVACVKMLITKLDINCIRKSHLTKASDPRYSTTASLMPNGTPLDLAEQAHNAFMDQKRRRASPENARYIISRFETIKKIMREYGAQTMDEPNTTVEEHT